VNIAESVDQITEGMFDRDQLAALQRVRDRRRGLHAAALARPRARARV